MSQQQNTKQSRHINLPHLFEISLLLDTYDDIFSDFDPRPYGQRALSDDFLLEAHKASRDKPSGKIELQLLMPAAQRNAQQENTIKRRLREHFRRHALLLAKEKHQQIKQGIFFTIAGVLTMFLTTLVMFTQQTKNFLFSFLVVLLEPAGWFLFWEGLRQAIFEHKSIQPNLTFYEKMSKCDIYFSSY